MVSSTPAFRRHQLILRVPARELAVVGTIQKQGARPRVRRAIDSFTRFQIQYTPHLGRGL
jgi:hypothetical protein